MVNPFAYPHHLLPVRPSGFEKFTPRGKANTGAAAGNLKTEARKAAAEGPTPGKGEGKGAGCFSRVPVFPLAPCFLVWAGLLGCSSACISG